jgi:hypothetical protein
MTIGETKDQADRRSEKVMQNGVGSSERGGALVGRQKTERLSHEAIHSDGSMIG